jgi:hypothetical protein
MKYAVEMGSVIMMNIPRLIEIVSGIQKLTHEKQGEFMNLLLFI